MNTDATGGTALPLRCVDLFCGAGGFSEGFRQAGVQVIQGFDLWAPAFVTHKKNHGDPGGGIRDVLALGPTGIPTADILIGSPPCTEFSFSNRGGGGDLEAGLLLVRRFLRLVHELRPKWWVMENVPRLLSFLGDEIPVRDLGIKRSGTLKIPVRRLLASADYGAPQQRVRAFFGNFPIPAPTHSGEPGHRQRWRTLGQVLATLGDPEVEPAADTRVTDPLYGSELAASELTDHYSRSLRLTDEEVREVRKAKVDHSWYGRMAFPDQLDRPARTVMATQLRVSRESIVVPTRDGGFRRLSIREMASCMGFPITYQFWGKTESIRCKLVGNAVAPTVSFAIAREILRAEGLRAPTRPRVVRGVAYPAPRAIESRSRRRQLSPDRRFREHIPGSKVPGFRVDFDNRGARPGRHLVEWRAVLYRGGGKTLEQKMVTLREAVRMLHSVVPDSEARRFQRDVERALHGIPDASTLQRIRAEQERGEVTPFVILDRIADLVSRHFDGNRHVQLNGHVPPRVAAALVATAYASAVANGRTSTLKM